MHRLIMFAIGVPAILLPVLALPYYNFLAFHIEVAIASVVATIEMHKLVKAKFEASTSPVLLSVLGTLVLVVGYLMNLNYANWGGIVALYLIAFFVLFMKEFVVSFNGDFEKVLHRLSAGMFILTYPWFFSIFFSKV